MTDKTEAAALEGERLAFIAKRDGTGAMREFARRTQRQYLAAIRESRKQCGNQYGAAYRRPLLESCLVFREVLRG